MSGIRLTVPELEVVRQCLAAAALGPFFPDWEFVTLFGVERKSVAATAEAWPDVDVSSSEVSLAVNNSFANLLGYPHGAEERWSDFISVTPIEVRRIFEKWRNQSTGQDSLNGRADG